MVVTLFATVEAVDNGGLLTWSKGAESSLYIWNGVLRACVVGGFQGARGSHTGACQCV
jgi:hypothetical protein